MNQVCILQNKDVYLLDDPLAAVDAHVAKHLYDKCIKGLLKNKTRILCTHHTKYLIEADFVIEMKDGIIANIGMKNICKHILDIDCNVSTINIDDLR